MNGLAATLRAFVSFGVVLALLAALVWTVRRGSFRLSRRNPLQSIVVETATSMGERRSLAIVGVEGRRFLIALSPGSISLIADLAPAAAPAGGPVAPESAS